MHSNKSCRTKFLSTPFSSENFWNYIVLARDVFFFLFFFLFYHFKYLISQVHQCDQVNSYCFKFERQFLLKRYPLHFFRLTGLAHKNTILLENIKNPSGVHKKMLWLVADWATKQQNGWNEMKLSMYRFGRWMKMNSSSVLRPFFKGKFRTSRTKIFIPHCFYPLRSIFTEKRYFVSWREKKLHIRILSDYKPFYVIVFCLVGIDKDSLFVSAAWILIFTFPESITTSLEKLTLFELKTHVIFHQKVIF